MNTVQQIKDLAYEIQDKIDGLYSKQPDNETFEQEGMLNGSQIVQEYLNESELGLAIEHLLYMIYESEIDYSNEIIEKINELTSKYKIKNVYL